MVEKIGISSEKNAFFQFGKLSPSVIGEDE
jgi:hypothetical protein